MSEENQDQGTTGPADEQGAIGADPTRDPVADPTAAPGPDDRELSGEPLADPETGRVPGVSYDNGEAVSLDAPYPHETQPGYGVTGKFPTDRADAGAVGFDAGEPIETVEPASETDALVAQQQAPVTAEQPASEADQLDVPADQRGDTA